MDFMNTVELDYMDKNWHKVRSWYLLEQYKSLEESQINAAKKLKDHSYQDLLLQREITERRERRSLYDRQGSKEKFNLGAQSPEVSTPTSISTDNFFENFSETHDNYNGYEKVVNAFGRYAMDQKETALDDWSSKDLVLKSEKQTSETSFNHDSESSQEKESIPETATTSIKSLRKNYQAELEGEDNILLETENNEDTDLMNKTFGEDKLSEILCLDECGKLALRKAIDKKCLSYDNNFNSMWSRLVSFAYQVMQLNHGNCYYDYSRQLLTTVLVCDIFLRGVSKMCNVLQPYTSPVKFCSVGEEIQDSLKENIETKETHTNKNNENFNTIVNSEVNKFKKRFNKKRNNRKSKCCHSEKRYKSKRSIYEKMGTTLRRSSEPLVKTVKLHILETDSNSSCDMSLELPVIMYLEEIARPRKTVNNPMLKLVRYIDEQLATRKDLLML